MATVNKSERKKLVSTSVVGSVVIFHRVDTGAELGRTDFTQHSAEVETQVSIYGVKQIVSDVNSQLEGEEKFAGITRAIADLNAGVWPARIGKAISPDAAMAALALHMGLTIEQMRAKMGL